MSRFYKIILGIFLLLLVFLTYLEASQPASLNWNPSYTANDKIPLGANVLFENLKNLDLEIQQVQEPPYEFVEKHASKGTYFFLNNQLVFGDAELHVLLDWVSKGNTLFMAAKHFSTNLLDTLQLEIVIAVPENGISSKPMVNLSHPELRAEKAFLFEHETYHSIFKGIDSIHKILGISQLYSGSLEIEKPKINFIETKFGKGKIYLNTSPAAFSNFFLLSDSNYKYAERALGYLPSGEKIFWDEYYKSGKSFNTSPLYILLNQKALKWAYYFAVFGVILFVLFEGKRKQRSIPVIPPTQNKSLEFTRTIAGLFLEKKEYSEIARKKILYFKEYIRERFKIPTVELNSGFYQKLSALSEKPVQEVEELFKLIALLEAKKSISKEELLQLNTAIQTFKSKTNGK